MFGLTTALFVTQGLDKEMIFSQNQNQAWPEIERETNHYCQMQLMGWALFFAWTNLTIFLGKLDFFERHIHMSRQIFMSVMWSIAVFLPTIVAFASAFHCFLIHDKIFDNFMASIIKTIGMLLGEVDIGDSFIHHNEGSTEGANPSAQIMLVMFIVYGILIFMNLLLALVVNKMDPANFWIAEIIPTKQRIQDISSMTDITSLICRWYQPISSRKEYPDTVCIATKPKEERSGFFGKFASQWVLKDHSSGNIRKCREIGKIGKFMRFSPSDQLVKQTIEMIKRKKIEEMDLLKAVRDVQAETEERLKELVFMSDANYGNPRLQRSFSPFF